MCEVIPLKILEPTERKRWRQGGTDAVEDEEEEEERDVSTMMLSRAFSHLTLPSHRGCTSILLVITSQR